MGALIQEWCRCECKERESDLIEMDPKERPRSVPMSTRQAGERGVVEVFLPRGSSAPGFCAQTFTVP